jgi:hypothetical protein
MGYVLSGKMETSLKSGEYLFESLGMKGNEGRRSLRKVMSAWTDLIKYVDKTPAQKRPL